MCVMKNEWNNRYTKNTNNGFSLEYFILIYWKNFFNWKKIVFSEV